MWPRNLDSCASGGDCTARFPYGQKDSYHYVLFGHSLAIPAWNSRYGSLTSITVNSGTTTIVTTDRGTGINECPSRITIAGVLGDPSLNGVYNTATCSDSLHITVATPGVPNWTYPNNTLPEPVIGITSGTVTSISGYSDLGGADSAVTLGLWETAPNQDMSKRAKVVAGTLFHEIGHTHWLDPRRTLLRHGPQLRSHLRCQLQAELSKRDELSVPARRGGAECRRCLLEPDARTIVYGRVDWVEPACRRQQQFCDVPNFGLVYLPRRASPTASPATLHCDGTPLDGDTGYRVNGTVAPISPAWSNGQNITFDGQT